MRWLILCVAVASASALNLYKEHPCDFKDCRAGRECVVVEEEAQCLCMVSCPDHFKPVCGSDGVSYDNHCKLHQKACVTDNHISIEHKGHCKKSHDKQWKKNKKNSLSKEDLREELQNDLIEILKKNEQKQLQDKKGPAVCYAPQRNALRFLLVEHWEDDLKKQEWHVEGMTYRESLWGWFYTCDKDDDNFLTPEELLTCAKDVAFFARPGQDTELTKALCIDALVDDGDKNRDWRLDFEEFTRVMNPKYQPKEKKCSLEGKNYLDGEEVHVDCNHCVCAVGNWVCASTDCAETLSHKKKDRKDHPRSSAIGRGAEIENGVDVSNDIIAEVPIADVWMENNRKDKLEAKQRKKNELEEEEEDNLFLDFDLINDDEEKEEDKQLGLDDYYDDLLEKTKLKNPKKKKFQLEKALKEVKMLRKKTELLQKLLVDQKDTDENVHARARTNETNKKAKKERKEMIKRDKKEEKFERKEKQDPKLKKYYDEVFKNTNWNDLINWGDMEKMPKSPKKLHHQNYV